MQLYSFNCENCNPIDTNPRFDLNCKFCNKYYITKNNILNEITDKEWEEIQKLMSNI